MSVLERMRNGVGLLTMVFFLAFDSSNVVTGLNADGVTLLEFKKGITWDPQNALQGWQSSDATPCLWSGITCIRIQSTMEDRVVGIALPRRALGGTISPKLGDLGYLATLSLHTNNLTGQIPAELFNATALTRVYLSGNNLTGAIPPEIRNLAEQLRVLELRGNRLTTLPHEILSCYRLRRLILSNNNISGTIPIGMGSQYSQLERLDLSVNRFTGTIPDDFGNLTSLLPQAPLNLSNNLLSGAIPPSLAGLQRVPIDVSHNQLSGQIPPDSYFQSQGPPAYVGNGALCGSPLKVDCASSPSPSPSPSSAASDVTAVVGIGTSSSSKRTLSKAAIVSIAVGCAIAGFILMATVVVYFVMRKLHISRKSLSQGRGESRSSLRGCLCSWRESATRAMSAEEDDGGDLVHLSGVLSFDLEELLRASAYVLGKSVVGIVYKAVLDEGTVVAVRRLGEGGEQKQKEFITEAKSIAQVRHPNIVTLHSYSWAVDEKLLVYDYLPNGSLETALHGKSDGSKGALTWEARLRIARGAAQGIAHIHECSPRKYIHGDIKPSNILLDPFLDARIADFGLRRLLSLSESERDKEHGSDKTDKGRASSVSPDPEFRTSSMSPHTIAPFLTGVYQAPEAVNAKRPSQKSDVYSFGVVLLELLTGRSPFKQLAAGQHNLVSWMRFALQQKKAFSEIFDPVLLTDDDDQSKMIETLQVALACIAVNPDSRPKMKQVAEFFQQLSKS